MPIILVGTTPVLLLNPNKERKRLMVQMQPSSVDTANTGIVFIGFGAQPVATVGNANQGETLVQAAYIDQPPGGAKLDRRYKRAVWAVADAASQSVVVEEEIEVTETKPKIEPL